MKKLAIVYWTGTGNTETMAEAVKEGFEEVSNDVDYIFSDDFDGADVQSYERIAFGCPAMGDEELEEDSFEPMFADAEEFLKDKEIFLFGSYSWADGEWMELWKERAEDDGAVLFEEPVIAFDDPEEDVLEELRAVGKKLAS